MSFSTAAMLGISGLLFLPIVNDRWDDPVGISVMSETLSSFKLSAPNFPLEVAFSFSASIK